MNAYFNLLFYSYFPFQHICLFFFPHDLIKLSTFLLLWCTVGANFINPPPPFLRHYVRNKMPGCYFVCDSFTFQGSELMGESCKQCISGSTIDYIWHSFHTMAPNAHNLFKAEDPVIFKCNNSSIFGTTWQSESFLFHVIVTSPFLFLISNEEWFILMPANFLLWGGGRSSASLIELYFKAYCILQTHIKIMVFLNFTVHCVYWHQYNCIRNTRGM